MSLTDIRVGHIVIPKDGHHFRSGCNWYSHAIVLCVEPFVMVSEFSDMLWSCFPIENVEVIGEVPPWTVWFYKWKRRDWKKALKDEK